MTVLLPGCITGGRLLGGTFLVYFICAAPPLTILALPVSGGCLKVVAAPTRLDGILLALLLQASHMRWRRHWHCIIAAVLVFHGGT